MYDEQHKNRLNAMKFKILKAEKDNLKAQRSDSEMVDVIRKIIINEANKIYGGTKHAD
ncbi:MAG: hypothetical protein IJG33_15160 [Selenomonadaceae bacterium]|nr:hypothetical protein [Selenomonadaceae bacterium]MBR0288123.1 hypothetical protein [Selenomonadaceae bacterium]